MRASRLTDWRTRMSCVSVQAPLQQYGTSGRYATALYVAATKAGNLSAVEGEVAQVRDALEDALDSTDDGDARGDRFVRRETDRWLARAITSH